VRANRPANETEQCRKEAAVVEGALAAGKFGFKDFRFPAPVTQQQ
jgi:hypothetical protein